MIKVDLDLMHSKAEIGLERVRVLEKSRCISKIMPPVKRCRQQVCLGKR